MDRWNMMAGYVIVDIRITDPQGYEEYRRAASPTISQYGGTYLVRAGAHEVAEGDWTPSRLVLLRFDSVEQARRWYDSPEYASARAIRERTAVSRLVFVEGIA